MKAVDLNNNALSVGMEQLLYVLDNVKVIQKGRYNKSNTTIDVINSGSDNKLRSNIQNELIYWCITKLIKLLMMME